MGSQRGDPCATFGGIGYARVRFVPRARYAVDEPTGADLGASGRGQGRDAGTAIILEDAVYVGFENR